MYKVFINDKPLIFSSGDDLPEYGPDTRVICAPAPGQMKESLTWFMHTNEISSLIFAGTQNVRELFNDFVSLFRYMEAAGGIVRNESGERLFIYRFGKWDLPKGKIEKGETPEMAALREVTEETRLTGQRITGKLPSTYHIYEHKGNQVLKKTFWYAMDYNGTEMPIPQTDESIVEARWFEQKDIEKVMENTYASLVDLIKADNR
jgi:ADP-ribose pyrophosphatase YjhB (NUDIX family)